MRRVPMMLLSAALLLTTACHVLPREARERVTPEATFEEVRAHPADHLGETLLLGGVIVGHWALEAGGATEIVRWRLDRWGEPVDIDDQGGRFLLRPPLPPDPVAFGPGHLVTLTATVTGRETGFPGPASFDLPVLQPQVVYPWVTPFRYLAHPYPDREIPVYAGPEAPPRDNPYSPEYYFYPYTPYWLRGYYGQ